MDLLFVKSILKADIVVGSLFRWFALFLDRL